MTPGNISAPARGRPWNPLDAVSLLTSLAQLRGLLFLDGRELRARRLPVGDGLLRDAEGQVAPGAVVLGLRGGLRLVLSFHAGFLQVLLRLGVRGADVAHVHPP